MNSENYKAAQRMLEDGASYREIARTIRVSAVTLSKTFPGRGWTYRKAGEFRQEIRRIEEMK